MRNLTGPGEWDYDYNNDILFFKVKNREYSNSIEFKSFVIDFDAENYIVGLQIFDASTLFKLPKISLKGINSWKLSAKIEDSSIEIDFLFNAVIRNKIVEKNPMIFERVSEEIPNSEMVCEVQ